MGSKIRSRISRSKCIEVNEHIHLTPIKHSDASRLAESLNDPVFYHQTCSIPYPYTLADANAFISAVQVFENQNKVQRDWVVRDKHDHLIGGIGLLFGHGINAHRSEMGFWLSKEYWNKGIMTEVVKCFTNWNLSETKLVRLEAFVFKDNLASCRVLEKAGFEKEGFLKKAFLKNGEYLDAWLYARTKC